MKRLLILVTFLGLTVHFCDVQGSAQRSQKELDKRLLDVALEGENFTAARNLINAGANVNAVANAVGTTALMFAVMDNDRELVEVLLPKAADVNVVNRRGMTALMLAAEQNNCELVELLLRAGAITNAVDHTEIISN